VFSNGDGAHQKQACAVRLDGAVIKDFGNQIRNAEVDVMQTQLSPAHPDFGKVGFAELEDRIRKRAYELYAKRGYVRGYALDDWLEAKTEVLGVTKGESYLENVPLFAKKVNAAA
jgi:DUF2934 family protein